MKEITEALAKSSVEVKHIKAKSITLVNDNGNPVIEMNGDVNGGGIWLHRPNGDLIAIFALEDQMGFGFYKKSDVSDSGGMSLAFMLDQSGVPHVQVRGKDNSTKILSWDDVVAAVATIQTAEQQG